MEIVRSWKKMKWKTHNNNDNNNNNDDNNNNDKPTNNQNNAQSVSIDLETLFEKTQKCVSLFESLVCSKSLR